MIKTINENEFINEWNEWVDRKDTFSYDGKRALFNYLEEYEESTGEKVELDIIALCCDYTEYDSFEDFQAQYQNPKIKDIEDLNDYTQVIPIDNAMKTESFIIQNF